MGWIRQATMHSVSEQSKAKAYDIGKRIEFLTVDIITRMCLGTAFGCVASDTDKYDFLKTVKKGTPFCQYLSVFHEINSLLFYITKIPIISRYIIPRSSDESGIGRILGVCKAAICVWSLLNGIRSYGQLESSVKMSAPVRPLTCLPHSSTKTSQM